MNATTTPNPGTADTTTTKGLSTTTPAANAIHPAIQYLFIGYYGIVFLSGLVGNIIIILSVYKFKRMRTVVNIFLVNLALADLLFVGLSLFDGLTFLHSEWIFGDLACRVQSTLIELSYTVSVCTLTVVAFERYMSICHPHKLKRTFKQAVKVCGLVWLFGVLFCACLFYGYRVRPDDNNVMQCRNDNWSNESRLSFYGIHSIIVYLLPLTIMCSSHVNISKVLMEQRVRTAFPQTFTALNKTGESSSEDAVPKKLKQKVSAQMSTASTNQLKSETKQKQKTVNRRMKIVRLLVVVTAIFFVLWTPFIIVRLIQYIDVQVNEMLWRASQLLIFGNTAINFFIYALMSPAFRTAFKGLFMCSTTLTAARMNAMNNSKSFDLSETLKKQSTLSRSNQRINKV